MTILEAQLVAKLIRWASSRVVHALGDGIRVSNWRTDEKRFEQEDEALIENYLRGRER